MRFVMFDLLEAERELAALPAFAGVDRDTIDAVLSGEDLRLMQILCQHLGSALRRVRLDSERAAAHAQDIGEVLWPGGSCVPGVRVHVSPPAAHTRMSSSPKAGAQWTTPVPESAVT